MALWRDLRPEEQCVLALADSADGSGLPNIVNGWDHWWQPDDLPAYMRTLGEAIVSLVSAGLVVVYRGMSPGDPEMTIEAIRPACANPRNWFYGDDGLDQVLWVSTTEAGTRVLADAQPDDVLKYFDMRHAVRRKKRSPLEEPCDPFAQQAGFGDAEACVGHGVGIVGGGDDPEE